MAAKHPSKRKGRKPAPKSRPGLIRRVLFWPFRLIWRFAWRIGLVVSLMTASAVIYFAIGLPNAADMVDGRARGSVTFVDRNGQVFAWRGDQFGGVITATSVSPALKNAVIATEDKRFYHFYHFGIDIYATVAAMVRNARTGGNPLSGAGGSSITQQTAKLLCFGQPYDANIWPSEAAYERDCRRTTLWRKLKEATYAIAMELRYTKDEILTIYLNRAFLGAGARGFEAAAQRYFGVSAQEVTVPQAAMLAGLLKAPSRLAPTNNLSAAQDRAGVVIQLMQDQGYITAGEADFARVKPAELSGAATARTGGYFADWVMAAGPEYFTRTTTEDVIIKTTLAPRIQTIAEHAVAKVFAEKVSATSQAQAAVVVMSADGAVRAMVGGRTHPMAGAFNRAIQAKRQTGSTFKPFVYATALELGYSPLDIIRDEPITLNVPGSGRWTPTNYNNEFKGDVTLTQALAESLNIPAVKLSESVGRDLVRQVAQDFGINSDLATGPALALGASESSLLEMTGAYAGILNGGSSVIPYGLEELRFQGDATPLIGQGGGIGERVISERAAQLLTRMMVAVVDSGTGRRAQITGVQSAAKTGTTQAARDAWFIGFTSNYVVGVWMGNDDNTPLRQVTGGSLPADIWRETMAQIVKIDAPGPLNTGPAPEPVQTPQSTPPTAQPNTGRSVLETLLGILGGN
ncbi:MAG: transglycosylase domain-containing protein [Pseudomonadota bacterium]